MVYEQNLIPILNIVFLSVLIFSSLLRVRNLNFIFPLFLIVVLSELLLSGNTMFHLTDWPDYRSMKLEQFVPTSYFSGDRAFWELMLVVNNSEISGFATHLSFKVLMISIFIFALKKIQISKSSIYFSSILWFSSLGFSMASEWYLRQGIAFHLLLLFMFLITYSSIYNFKKNDLSFIYETYKKARYLLVTIVIALTHFGTFFHCLIFIFGNYLRVFWNELIFSSSKKDTVNSRFDIFLFGLFIFILFFVIFGFIKFANLDIYISNRMNGFKDTKFPYSAILVFVILYLNYESIRSNFIKLKNGNYLDSLSIRKIYSHLNLIKIFIFFQAVGVAVYFSYPYLLRINNFKDAYIAVSAGILFNFVEKYYKRSQGSISWIEISMFINIAYLIFLLVVRLI